MQTKTFLKKMKTNNIVVSFIKKHWFLTLAVLSFTLFCVYAKILDAMEPRYTSKELSNSISEYINKKGDTLENLVSAFLDVAEPFEQGFGILQFVNRNHHEMHLYTTQKEQWRLLRVDSSHLEKELFKLYSKCFHKNPIYETGPEVWCQNNIAEIKISFGYNYCDNHPHMLYTKLDTTELKSRYPSLPYYPKESQPRDSECTYIWELDDNWYIIAN